MSFKRRSTLPFASNLANLERLDEIRLPGVEMSGLPQMTPEKQTPVWTLVLAAIPLLAGSIALAWRADALAHTSAVYEAFELAGFSMLLFGACFDPLNALHNLADELREFWLVKWLRLPFTRAHVARAPRFRAPRFKWLGFPFLIAGTVLVIGGWIGRHWPFSPWAGFPLPR
jgi:hypothetical protein